MISFQLFPLFFPSSNWMVLSDLCSTIHLIYIIKFSSFLDKKCMQIAIDKKARTHFTMKQFAVIKFYWLDRWCHIVLNIDFTTHIKTFRKEALNTKSDYPIIQSHPSSSLFYCSFFSIFGRKTVLTLLWKRFQLIFFYVNIWNGKGFICCFCCFFSNPSPNVFFLFFRRSHGVEKSADLCCAWIVQNRIGNFDS